MGQNRKKEFIKLIDVVKLRTFCAKNKSIVKINTRKPTAGLNVDSWRTNPYNNKYTVTALLLGAAMYLMATMIISGYCLKFLFYFQHLFDYLKIISCFLSSRIIT